MRICKRTEEMNESWQIGVGFEVKQKCVVFIDVSKAADRSALLITVVLCLSASLTALGLAAAFHYCKTDLALAYRNLWGVFTQREGCLSCRNVPPQTSSQWRLNETLPSALQLLTGSSMTPTSATSIPAAGPTRPKCSPCKCFLRNWRRNMATLCTSEAEMIALEKVRRRSFL